MSEPTQSPEQTQGRRRKQIERYVVFYDILMRGSAGSEVDAHQKARPAGSMPISEKGLDFIDLECNQVARKVIEPEIRWLRRTYFDYYRALSRVGGFLDEPDHGALRRWRAGETEDDRRWLYSFDRGIEKIEERIREKYPDLELEVKLPEKRDEPTGSAREDSMRELRWRTEDTYRKIASKVEGIQEAECCTLKEAMEIYREQLKELKRPDISIRKIHTARAFVRAEREGNQREALKILGELDGRRTV